MIKKGFDLFTTRASVMEEWRFQKDVRCCDVCTTPLLGLCKRFCKWRTATLIEFADAVTKTRK